MIRILFICHGNICRSPMAEFVMKDLVKKAGLSSRFEIASAATSTEELGNSVYPPARRKLAEHSIDCTGKTARQLRREDYARWDYLIGMDEANRRNITRMCHGDPQGKISLLLDHPPAPVRWPIPGTPGTSSEHGRMCWRAVPPYWQKFGKRKDFDRFPS